MKRLPARLNGIGSAAVKAASGRTWADWVGLLDRAGAKSWTHTEIVLWLQKRQKLAEGWCQTVTVGYEQATGRRVKHQKSHGFEIGVSKTIAAPVAVAFEAWKDATVRERWLPAAPLTVRKATPHKSIRITWGDGTNLSVNFWPKGALKCQVVPQHAQLATAAEAEKMKAFWTDRLEALRALLENTPVAASSSPDVS